GEQAAFHRVELRGRQRNTVKLFEQIGDAAALEHDAAPRDLRGMRRKDWGDRDASKQTQRFCSVGARFAQTPQRSAQAAALRWCGRIQQRGRAATLAVIGLSEVDKLEVERERARQLVSLSEIGGRGVRQPL